MLLVGTSPGLQGARDLGWTQVLESPSPPMETRFILGHPAVSARQRRHSDAGSEIAGPPPAALRVFAAPFLRREMIATRSDATLILPLASRYEAVGGTTHTSADRQLRFSPQVLGHRIEGAMPDWWIPLRILEMIHEPSVGSERDPVDWVTDLRCRMEAAVPRLKGLASLRAPGESIQWGGRSLAVQKRA